MSAARCRPRCNLKPCLSSRASSSASLWRISPAWSFLLSTTATSFFLSTRTAVRRRCLFVCLFFLVWIPSTVLTPSLCRRCPPRGGVGAHGERKDRQSPRRLSSGRRRHGGRWPTSNCLSVCLYVCVSACLSVCVSVCLPDCPPVYMSVSLSLSVCLSVYNL